MFGHVTHPCSVKERRVILEMGSGRREWHRAGVAQGRRKRGGERERAWPGSEGSFPGRTPGLIWEVAGS